MIYIICSGMMQFAVHPQRNPATKQHICIIKIFHWPTIYYPRFHHLQNNIENLIYFNFVYDIDNFGVFISLHILFIYHYAIS